jgi:hypothetical protein
MTDTTDHQGAHVAGSGSGDPSATSASPEVAAIEADIERTREDLAQTVDQLTAKLDVKTRVQTRVADARDSAAAKVHTLQDRATDDDGRPTPEAMRAGGAAVAAAVAVLVVWLWRHNRAPRRRR